MPDAPLSPPELEPGEVPAQPLEVRKRPSELRSARWFGPADLRSFGHRSRAMQMGYAPEEWTGKPVIAILNTWSDLQPCHMHFKQRVDDVKRGILMAGGFPVELPALSMSESYLKPTSMLYRNMLAMEAEELLRSHPVDGAVLMGGCDKSTPGLLLGATSMDVPAIFLPAGPMLRGNWQGKVLGSGSDSWKYWDELRAGKITDQDWLGVEGGIARSYGTCMTMGTASTMTAIAEAVGMVLPGGSSIPAADAGHIRLACESGRRIVDMVWEDLTPSRIQTRAAFGNAIAVAMAMGCSTNAIIHLIAMARRAGHDVGLADFERYSRRVPVIGNVRPSGDKYLMEDFFYAGGIRALMNEIREHLDLDCLTVTGRTLGENIDGAKVYDADVIRPTSDPIYGEGSLAVLHGNLAPDGCVIKPAAMDQRFLRHSGPALVFDDYPSLKKAIDDEDLDVTADTSWCCATPGRRAAPACRNGACCPCRRSCSSRATATCCACRTRACRARATGPACCTCRRKATSAGRWRCCAPATSSRSTSTRAPSAWRCPTRSWRRAAPPGRRRRPATSAATAGPSPKHIQQADQGCDFDFLRTEFGAPVPEPAIF